MVWVGVLFSSCTVLIACCFILFPNTFNTLSGKLLIWSENMLEQESFWNADSFAVITDNTRPAMKWTIEELTRMGKKVSVVDLSNKGSSEKISALPSDTECAVLGVTKVDPAIVMEDLEKKGITRFWVHWRTETSQVRERCASSQVQCVLGKCPMMYLAHGLNMHTLHRGFAKLIGKY